MSDGGEMTGCRPSAAAAAAAATPLDDDDILSQILLRLPPRPSSLPRAAAVCRRWRRLVSAPHFRRSFHAHHRKPPLLGLFTEESKGEIGFTPALDPPDRIPAARFSLRLDAGSEFLGCRHGRVLFLNRDRLQFLVWDPVTGDQLLVPFPPVFSGSERYYFSGAVICADGDQDHMHGDCHHSPFQVAMIGRGKEGMLACVYSSETDSWGNLITMLWPAEAMTVSTDIPSTLVGNSLCWLLIGGNVGILEFDLDRQILAIIDPPEDAIDICAFSIGNSQVMITPTGGDGLGLLILSGFTAELWKRKVNSDGAVRWLLTNTIELCSLLQLVPWVDPPTLLGIAEDDNAMLVLTHDDVVFMVHLESPRFDKLPEKMSYCFCQAFTSFYTAGMVTGAEHDGLEVLHNA